MERIDCSKCIHAPEGVPQYTPERGLSTPEKLRACVIAGGDCVVFSQLIDNEIREAQGHIDLATVNQETTRT